MENTKYVKKQENGIILLISSELSNKFAPNGIKNTSVTISRKDDAISSFIDFLDEKKDLYECVIEGNKYRAFRDLGCVYLEETRDSTVSIVGFSSKEIPNVLEELKEM